MALDHIGGTFAQNVQATPFICLVLKMLQIQPSKDIIVEFIRRSDYKYVRALGAYYMRLVGTSLDIYKYLEPLYIDYRKLKYKNVDGGYVLTHMDEYVDNLLTDDRVFNILLPRLQKRWVLEESEILLPRISALEDELIGDGSLSESETSTSGSHDSCTILPKHSKMYTGISNLHKSRHTPSQYSGNRSDSYRCSRLSSKSPYRGYSHKRSRSRSSSPQHNTKFSQNRSTIPIIERAKNSCKVRKREKRKENEYIPIKVGDIKKTYTKEQLGEIQVQNELRESLGLKPLRV